MIRSPTSAAHVLARRLKSLREQGLNGASVTQKQIAEALGGVAISTISGWENPAGTPIPLRRIESLARFYATPKSIEGTPARLVPANHLSSDERKRLKELEAELRELRVAAKGQPDRLWRFGDGRPITVVCRDLSDDEGPLHPYANPEHPNYTWSYNLMDFDAAWQLNVHLRAENPRAPIQVKPLSQLGREDVSDHVVILGSLSEEPVWLKHMVDQIGLPIEQGEEDGCFMRTDDGAEPLGHAMGADGRLVEDVGVFSRAPNPANTQCTLTLCNGVYTRGVHGAVLCFMHDKLREPNESYVAEKFGTADTYLIVMRVQVVGVEPLAPDLHRDGVVRSSWPPP